jgi:hypothetical protein
LEDPSKVRQFFSPLNLSIDYSRWRRKEGRKEGGMGKGRKGEREERRKGKNEEGWKGGREEKEFEITFVKNVAGGRQEGKKGRKKERRKGRNEETRSHGYTCRR